MMPAKDKPMVAKEAHLTASMRLENGKTTSTVRNMTPKIGKSSDFRAASPSSAPPPQFRKAVNKELWRCLVLRICASASSSLPFAVSAQRSSSRTRTSAESSPEEEKAASLRTSQSLTSAAEAALSKAASDALVSLDISGANNPCVRNIALAAALASPAASAAARSKVTTMALRRVPRETADAFKMAPSPIKATHGAIAPNRINPASIPKTPRPPPRCRGAERPITACSKEWISVPLASNAPKAKGCKAAGTSRRNNSARAVNSAAAAGVITGSPASDKGDPPPPPPKAPPSAA
mmetsp:Transcript_166187/g.533477  ORF Transcript_166187/g.533477 Transcript_166187/m.533477 type:complete len:294 (+) Transcript_166187:3065-3946(+)